MKRFSEFVLSEDLTQKSHEDLKKIEMRHLRAGVRHNLSKKASDELNAVQAEIKRRKSVSEESLEEKTLTSAEKKKREEIAQAIERDNPEMPMSKKMAIATAKAKQVAESDQLDEAKGEMSKDQILKRISNGTHEAMTDVVPGRHVELRHVATGKKSMVFVKRMAEEESDPCWKGYQMVGTKKKNGKEVPNCVPVSEEVKEGDLVKDPFGEVHKVLKRNDTVLTVAKYHGKGSNTLGKTTQLHASKATKVNESLVESTLPETQYVKKFKQEHPGAQLVKHNSRRYDGSEGADFRKGPLVHHQFEETHKDGSRTIHNIAHYSDAGKTEHSHYTLPAPKKGKQGPSTGTVTKVVNDTLRESLEEAAPASKTKFRQFTKMKREEKLVDTGKTEVKVNPKI